MSVFEPGTRGIPNFCAVILASILSPIHLICSGLGPIKTILWASTISAKSAFSDKKPTPGCIASAPTNCAAVIIAGMFKYDLEDGAGPMQTLSSANLTCMASLSAVE